jgi:hypothetical protein
VVVNLVVASPEACLLVYLSQLEVSQVVFQAVDSQEVSLEVSLEVDSQEVSLEVDSQEVSLEVDSQEVSLEVDSQEVSLEVSLEASLEARLGEILVRLRQLVASQAAHLVVLPEVHLAVDSQVDSQVACLLAHLSRPEASQVAHLVVCPADVPTVAPQELQHQQAVSQAGRMASPTPAHLNSPAPSPSTTNSRPLPALSSSAKVPLSPASRSSTPLTVFPPADLPSPQAARHSLASLAHHHQVSPCQQAAHPTPSHPTPPASPAVTSRRSPRQPELLAFPVRRSPRAVSLAFQAAHLLALAFLRCLPHSRPLRADRVQQVGSRRSRGSRRMMGARRMMAGGGT